jgi:integrase
MDRAPSADLRFREAFELWIERRLISPGLGLARARYISPRAERDLRQYARAVEKFFSSLRLDQIHAGHLHAYQKARATNDLDGEQPWEHAAGANLVRKEVQTLVRVLKAAGAWSAHLEESFEPLQPDLEAAPRALSPEQQHAWLHTASSRPEWRVVYWWSIVALETTMSTNELRALRVGDVYLEQGTVQVRPEGAKNRFRVRLIPLGSPELAWALQSLIDRAREMGSTSPQHYLFPFHVTQDRYDPARPMTVWGLRKPWEAARAAAKLDWLKPYDLRHTAITRMAEAGAPIQVIMSFAGHISPRMQQHYTAISMAAKRHWAAAAWSPSPHVLGAPPPPSSGRGVWVWEPERKVS